MFNVIKVTSFFCQCKLSLSSWLGKAIAGWATTLTIAAAVRNFTIYSVFITACSTNNDTTPNDIRVIGMDRYLYRFRLTSIELVIIILWNRIYGKTPNKVWSNCNAASSLITVRIFCAFSTTWSSVCGTCWKSKPHRLWAQIS